MLRYNIMEPTRNAQKFYEVHTDEDFTPTPFPFSVNSESGEVYAISGLLPGLYRFNVSVTDAKFAVLTVVSVDVSDIDQV